MFFCFVLVFFLAGFVSMCSLGCPGTRYVDQASLGLICLCLLNAEIDGMCHHVQVNFSVYKVMGFVVTFVCVYFCTLLTFTPSPRLLVPPPPFLCFPSSFREDKMSLIASSTFVTFCFLDDSHSD